MLRDGSFAGSGEWGTKGGDGDEMRAGTRRHVQVADDARCEQIHRRLKRIVKVRAALDLEEAAALRDAEVACIWRRYGCASLLEYMERELGYTPRVAKERLRVANVIDELPQIREAMMQGELSFSAVRELTRVATAETEGEWLAASSEMNQRELEELVSGHKRGDRPSDRPDPALRWKDLHLKVRPETYALMRQAQQILNKERGERVDEDTYLAATARLIIDGIRPLRVSAMESSSASPSSRAGASSAAAASASSFAGASTTEQLERGDTSTEEHVEPNDVDDGPRSIRCRTRAPYQIAVTVCRECKRGWQDGGGITVEMSPAAVARARCDAELIGSIDGVVPERAKQTIPPSVRRFVWARDHGRCQVPGCRSSVNLDVHHIEHQEDGGSNEPLNLILLCEGHHLAHHAGNLIITGTAAQLTISRRASSSFTAATRVVETTKALATLGYSKREAREAAEQTRTHVGAADWSIDAWIKHALSKCPRS